MWSQTVCDVGRRICGVRQCVNGRVLTMWDDVYLGSDSV